MIRQEFFPEPPPVALTSNAGGAAVSRSVRHSKPVTREALSVLLDLTQRRLAVAEKKFSPEWASGKFVLIKFHAGTRPVLLTEPLGADRWHALMAAPECDWAGAEDVLLEAEDEPFDPLCGMVQTWNKLVVHRKNRASELVLGELSRKRYAAVKEVAVETSSMSVEGRPGVIALRSLRSGETVLTGSSVSNADLEDPRREYRKLYSQLAASAS